MYGYFCILFIEYTNLSSFGDFKKNDKIIKTYFE